MPSYNSIGGDWVKKVNKPVEITIEDKPVEEIVEVVNPELDLNKDGAIDTKDASIAGKVMNEVKKRKYNKRVK
jgi:O-acetyl-ADP-ribose deacetylase (regulator of RNase III)